jgi:hypothetical protein
MGQELKDFPIINIDTGHSSAIGRWMRQLKEIIVKFHSITACHSELISACYYAISFPEALL